MLYFNHFYHLFEEVWPIAASMRVWSRTILLLGLGWLMSISPALASWQQTFVGKNADDGEVLALAVDKNQNLYAAGSFTSIGGVAANHIAKWDGEKWTALGNGRDNPVSNLAVDSVGNVYTLEKAQIVAKWDQSGWTDLSLEGLILPKYQEKDSRGDKIYQSVNFNIKAMVIDDNLYLGGITSAYIIDPEDTVNAMFDFAESIEKSSFSRKRESTTSSFGYPLSWV
jgi:hypothetical protein